MDLSLYPVGAMAYPDAVRRAPSVSTVTSTQGVAAPTAVAPVQSATSGQGGLPYTPPRRDSRPARLRRDTPESAYGPYSLSFGSVLARYRQ